MNQYFSVTIISVLLLVISCDSTDPSSPNIHEMSKAVGVAETSQLKNAEKLLIPLLEDNPTWGEGWIYLGRSLAAQDRYAEGAAAMGKAGNLGERRSTVWLEACSMAIKSGNQQLALTYFQNALQAKIHRKWLIQDHSFDGFLDLGNFLKQDAARKLLMNAASKRPSLHPDLIAIERKIFANDNGLLSFNAEEIQVMIQEYTNLVKSLPEHGELYYFLAKLQLRLANYKEALITFQQVKKLDYQSPMVIDGWLAYVNAHLGNHDAAFEHLERNLASNDTPDWIFNPGEFDSLYNNPRWKEMVDKYRVTNTPLVQIPAKSQGSIPFPTKEWQRADPMQVGINENMLLEAAQFIEGSFTNVTSLLLVKNGQLVFERYFNGYTDQDAFNIKSATKSFTSILAGIMYDKGILPNLNTPIIEILPEYFIDIDDPLKKEITLKHLLTMTTGIEYSENGSKSLELFLTGNYAQLNLNQKQLYKPGEVYEYSSPVTHLLAVVLAELSGQDLLSYAQKNLFDPLGIAPEVWAQDLNGYYLGDSELRLRPQDFAKFGLLILRGGEWEGKTIVSEEWIRRATDIQIPIAHGPHSAYGYQFWVFNVKGHRVSHARGYAGQKCVIIPSLDIVCVMTSESVLPEIDPGFIIGQWIIPSVENFNPK